MRGLKVWAGLALCLALFAVPGCGKQDLLKPPKILYGRDVCAQCRMIIDDERFAGAAVSADGQFLKFDDIGCLAAHEKEPESRMLRSWVHDAVSGKWIGREQARFVYARDLVSPMGYGFAAFAVAEDAERWAQEKAGRLVTWNELLDLTGKQNDFKMEELE